MTNGSDFSTPESEFINLPSLLEHTNPVAGCALKHPKGPLLLMGGSLQLQLETSPTHTPAGRKTARRRLPSLEAAAIFMVVGVRNKKARGGDKDCGKVTHPQDNCLPRAADAGELFKYRKRERWDRVWARGLTLPARHGLLLKTYSDLCVDRGLHL